MFIKKLIIMWDKKLKLDFQNKNSNQAKSRLKPIDVSTRVEPLNADEIPVALDKVVLLNGLPKTPSFLISLCMENASVYVCILIGPCACVYACLCMWAYLCILIGVYEHVCACVCSHWCMYACGFMHVEVRCWHQMPCSIMFLYFIMQSLFLNLELFRFDWSS